MLDHRFKKYSEKILEEYKALYYYCRNCINHPYATVCILYKMIEGKPQIFARGVSICSIRDNINKRYGRELALERATSAIIFEEDWEEINEGNENICHIIYDLPDEIIFKSEYEPFLTPYEKKLLDKIMLKYN